MTDFSKICIDWVGQSERAASNGATIAARGLFGAVGKMVGVYFDSPAQPSWRCLKPQPETHHWKTCICPAAGMRFWRSKVSTPSFPIPASGEAPADSPVFEVYLNSPMDTAPEALVTEICLPLR